MPMFSPLVMISEVPKQPPTRDISASPRIVRGTSRRRFTGRPTTSLTATVWLVASAIETTLNRSIGSDASRSNFGQPNGKAVGRLSNGPANTASRRSMPATAATSVPATRPNMTASCPNRPGSTRTNSTVSRTVAIARPRPARSPNAGVPGRPAMTPPYTAIKFTPTSSSMVPITSGGKNRRQRENTGRISA